MDIPANVLEKLRRTNTYEFAARLVDGNKKFVEGKTVGSEKIDAGKRAELAAGQHPWLIVLTCSDSRVVPEYIFNVGLGECFSQEIAGNVATPEIIESLRYGVLHLGVRLALVLGHTSCGAVKAALEGHAHGVERIAGEIKGNIGNEKDATAAAKINAIQAAKKIERDGELKEPVAQGKLAVIAGVYSLETGKVEFIY